MTITLWKPETDVILHQALGKCAEECAELSQALARCLIQGFHEAEPVTHKLNRTQLFEEVADIKAALRWLFDVIDEPFKGESERERRKFDGFKRWQAMLEADGGAKGGAAPGTPPGSDDTCPICAEPFKSSDLCATDIELGICHAKCLEGSPVVDLDTGDEIPNGKLSTYPFA